MGRTHDDIIKWKHFPRYWRFIQGQIKENIKAPRHWPLWGEFTGDWWIPAQMASNAENVFIWWRHHELVFVVNIELISVPLGALMTGLLESMPADLRESRTMEMKLRTVCVCLLNTVLQNDFAEYWTANMPSRDQMQTKFSCCGIST